VAANEMTR